MLYCLPIIDLLSQNAFVKKRKLIVIIKGYDYAYAKFVEFNLNRTEWTIAKAKRVWKGFGS